LFLKSLPKDAIVMDWGYEADAPFAQRGAALQQHKIKWSVSKSLFSMLFSMLGPFCCYVGPFFTETSLFFFY